MKMWQPIGPQLDAGIPELVGNLQSKVILNPKPYLIAGIPELVGKLQRKAKAVFLVSGGFRVIINPIAQQLTIPLDHVFANTILHKVPSSSPSESSHPNRVQSSRFSLPDFPPPFFGQNS